MKDFLKVLVYGGLFAVPFLTMFVVNDYFFPFITGKNFAFRIIVEVVLVAWGLLMLVDAAYRPKFSWLMGSFGTLIVVMFFANLFGYDPHNGFFSNFERMDGYMTLIHTFAYFVVLGSVLQTKKQWNAFLHTTLGVAFVVSFYGLSQYAGTAEGFNGRIESFLGNAAYFAIYMYFHIFIAFWLFIENRSVMLRTIYTLLIALFVFTLLESGTRGTVLGLITGSSVMIAYIALFGAKYPVFRRYAIGAFALLLVLVGSFYVARKSSFIQDSPNLARIANIDLVSDLKVRTTIWGMAIEGVKERPLLGWGQGNFNYVFNEQYDPFLYNQEQWFDRPHNIVFDWLIAGGVLGFLAYFSIFAACLYYLFFIPWRNKEDQTFTVLERGVLLGILVGYLTHNLVVFDNIISYIFFAVILAVIHSRVAKPIPVLARLKVDNALFNQFFVPVAGVAVVALVYFLHVPGMQAASDIIDAYRQPLAADKLAAMSRALDRDSFAHQEITEQLAQQAMSAVRDPQVPDEVKENFITRAEAELKKLAANKPGDARVHVFFSSFYRAVGDLQAAEEQIKIAQELSPRKPAIVMQRGIVEFGQGDLVSARDFFKEAWELDKRNLEAQEFYIGMLFQNGEAEAAKALMTDEADIKRISKNDFVLQSANAAKDYAFIRDVYEVLVEESPEVQQNWASLSFAYYQLGDTEGAVTSLKRAMEAIPAFAPAATCFINNIEAGNPPDTDC